jgi:hypothetical protein
MIYTAHSSHQLRRKLWLRGHRPSSPNRTPLQHSSKEHGNCWTQSPPELPLEVAYSGELPTLPLSESLCKLYFTSHVMLKLIASQAKPIAGL